MSSLKVSGLPFSHQDLTMQPLFKASPGRNTIIEIKRRRPEDYTELLIDQFMHAMRWLVY